MTDRPLPPGAAALEAVAGPLDGRLPGGCDQCDGWQAVAKVGQMMALVVVHLDGCPVWAQLARPDDEPDP